jgi:tetratricopeptide (TPR) repeat protein
VERLGRGRGLALAGRLAEAAAVLAEAAAVAPRWSEPRLLLGLCQSQLGRADAALASLAIALDLSGPPPSRREQRAEYAEYAELRATAYFERGNVQARVGRPAEAMSAYAAVLALQPQHAHAYSNIGVVHYGAARYSEAARRFGAATRLHPGFADAYQHHGAALKALGALDEAYASYGHAAGLVGGASSEPLRGMALVERERGRLPQALKLLAAAVAIAPAVAQLHVDRGVVHDYAEARLASIEAYPDP